MSSTRESTPRSGGGQAFADSRVHKRPVVLAVIVGAVTLAINIYFW